MQQIRVPRFETSSSPTASRILSATKSIDTKCEMQLRSVLWRMGLRFRKNVRDLPGKPDIVFPKQRVVVFCDGDFWHGRNWPARKRRLHKGANALYWTKKIGANIQRDRLLEQDLQRLGWKVLRLWSRTYYIGEGFDDARLDTLFLAMPISWRGTLQQYVGRLHRLHENKHVVRVYDYVDACVLVLNRMYEKRLKAYKAVGYTVTRPPGEQDAQADLRFAEIEQIAVRAAIAFEEARGCKVESVESETRGFDLVSRRLPADPSREEIGTRFIEVKGRAGVGEIALTANEYKAAQSLSDEYWLYVVFNCASEPQVTAIQNPARLEWEALSKIDCYRIRAEGLLQGTT